MKKDLSLTVREKTAIRALRRLGKSWPQTLSVLSWSGSLVVVPTIERGAPSPKRCIDISGIPNDGGDPDNNLDPDDLADWSDVDYEAYQ